MARGVRHNPEVRAAVTAALLAGQGVGEIAAQYKLNESSIRNWRRLLPTEQLATVNTKKAEQLDELLFGYLHANLTALRAQAEVVSEPEYIRAQPASELATLHGVMADKAIRILDAAERAGAFDARRTPAGAGEPD